MEIIKKLHSDKTPEVDEICPEMVKALVGMPHVILLLSVIQGTESVPMSWQTRMVY